MTCSLYARACTVPYCMYVLPPTRSTQPHSFSYTSWEQGSLSMELPRTLQLRRWIFFDFDFPKCCFVMAGVDTKSHVPGWCFSKSIGCSWDRNCTESLQDLDLKEDVSLPWLSSYCRVTSGFPNLGFGPDCPIGLFLCGAFQQMHTRSVTCCLVSSISSLKAWGWWGQAR